MSFNFKWQVRDSFVYKVQDREIQTYRFCKAYVSKEVKEAILKQPFKDYGNNQVLYGSILDYPEDSDMKTLIIAPERLEDRFEMKINSHRENVQIQYWENILQYDPQKFSLSTTLACIEKLDRTGKYQVIYFTPHGLEDEGQLLDEFMKKDHQARMVAVVKDILDCYDLRLSPQGTIIQL